MKTIRVAIFLLGLVQVGINLALAFNEWTLPVAVKGGLVICSGMAAWALNQLPAFQDREP